MSAGEGCLFYGFPVSAESVIKNTKPVNLTRVHQRSDTAHTKTRLKKKKGEDGMDFSNMGVSDWIIRTAIFGVLACAVIGTLQNLMDALTARKSRKSE
jgi:hypothetical protein